MEPVKFKDLPLGTICQIGRSIVIKTTEVSTEYGAYANAIEIPDPRLCCSVEIDEELEIKSLIDIIPLATEEDN